MSVTYRLQDDVVAIALEGENPPDAAYGIGVMTNLEADFGPFIAHR